MALQDEEGGFMKYLLGLQSLKAGERVEKSRCILDTWTENLEVHVGLPICEIQSLLKATLSGKRDSNLTILQ